MTGALSGRIHHLSSIVRNVCFRHVNAVDERLNERKYNRPVDAAVRIGSVMLSCYQQQFPSCAVPVL